MNIKYSFARLQNKPNQTQFQTRRRFLFRSGVSRDNAWNPAGSSKGWWRMSGTLQAHLAMNGQCFEELGLVSLSAGWQMLQTEGNRRAAG